MQSCFSFLISAYMFCFFDCYNFASFAVYSSCLARVGYTLLFCGCLQKVSSIVYFICCLLPVVNLIKVVKHGGTIMVFNIPQGRIFPLASPAWLVTRASLCGPASSWEHLFCSVVSFVILGSIWLCLSTTQLLHGDYAAVVKTFIPRASVIFRKLSLVNSLPFSTTKILGEPPYSTVKSFEKSNKSNTFTWLVLCDTLYDVSNAVWSIYSFKVPISIS